MDKRFLTELSVFCRSLKQDIWILGEVINGDYNEWVNAEMLDSTTNYDAYKGLYSSHNDHNYYEIAHTLIRQFGDHGIYKNLKLYNFADNHDTTRIISILSYQSHIFPLHAILFTMPGIPSVYYGSEWGIEGVKGEHEDTSLRPVVDKIPDLNSFPLNNYVKHLIQIRHLYPALRDGSYRQMYVSHEQLVFERSNTDRTVIVAVNAAGEAISLTVWFLQTENVKFFDAMDPEYQIFNYEQQLVIYNIPAFGARILVECKI